ncbi:hypothetical protein [Pseudomonas sp. Sample_23]|uniref:hypothetical protein n=1 Tax=Pseudomonas sp. Sample_23 TaxID=2448267 RepID=UPI001032A05E|nr:hypothetical protein [Pseudomonas sp. Sample_23]
MKTWAEGPPGSEVAPVILQGWAVGGNESYDDVGFFERSLAMSLSKNRISLKIWIVIIFQLFAI